MSIRSDVRHFVLIHIYNLLLPHSYHNKIYRYDAVPSSHVPPFWHGTLPQSSWLISQLVPRNPVGQVQLYPPSLCWHTPLFKHGEGVQKSTVVLQVGPVQMQLFNNVIQGMWKFPIKSIVYWVYSDLWRIPDSYRRSHWPDPGKCRCSHMACWCNRLYLSRTYFLNF